MPQKVEVQPATKIEVTGVTGFIKRQVTAYGTGAKVTCPKEYLGKTVYLIIVDQTTQTQTQNNTTQRSQQ
jgi:putative transposon-encoded protein